MKRDWRLIRKILLTAENGPTAPPTYYGENECFGCTKVGLNGDDDGRKAFSLHTQMLFSGDFMPSYGETIPYRLTMRGHDLVEQLRDEAVFEQALSEIEQFTGYGSPMPWLLERMAAIRAAKKAGAF